MPLIFQTYFKQSNFYSIAIIQQKNRDNRHSHFSKEQYLSCRPNSAFFFNQISFLLNMSLMRVGLCFMIVSKFSIFIISDRLMIHEPSSPNIFDAVFLTSSKQPSPSVQTFAQSTFYFNKKLQSISQFLDFLECHPDSQAELTEIQIRWERNFFKNELKAALFLNYSLINLYSTRSQELKILKSGIHNHTEKKKIAQEIDAKLEWSASYSDNSQENHPSSTLKKKIVREAFEAEKNIIQAKHQKECEELKKAIENKDCLIRTGKEENQYIRGELLEISQKNFALLNANREAEEQKRQMEEENKLLKAKLEAFQERERKESPEKKFNRLNCSPIIRVMDPFTVEEQQISFHNEFFNESIIENKLLKKQIEDVQFQLQEIKQQNARLLASSNHHSEQHRHREVMQQSCRLFLVQLENQYIEIKKDLQSSMEEISKYKSIIQRIHQEALQSEKRSEKPCQKCSNCQSLQKNFESLKRQNHQIQMKYQSLREKFDKTLNLELNQRQQWDTFLKDLTSSPNE